MDGWMLGSSVHSFNQSNNLPVNCSVAPAAVSSSDVRRKELKGSICLAFSTGGFFNSSIIQQRLITRFVPFLPLSRHHVERCVRSQLCSQGLCSHDDIVEAVGGAMTYTPVQGHYFSSTGCKAVTAKINLFLWVEEQLILTVGTTKKSTHWSSELHQINRDSELEIHPVGRVRENWTRKMQDSLWFWKVILKASVQKRLLDFPRRHCTAVPPGGLGAVWFFYQ